MNQTRAIQREVIQVLLTLAVALAIGFVAKRSHGTGIRQPVRRRQGRRACGPSRQPLRFAQPERQEAWSNARRRSSGPWKAADEASTALAPPSTGITAPVTYAARGEARKAITSAISSGAAGRRNGVSRLHSQ